MHKLTVNGLWTQFVGPLRDRQPFRTGGALRGEPGRAVSLGRLPDPFRTPAGADTVDYVVYSYATPIAWHDSRTGWVVPGVRYSVTTSKHQGRIATAVSQIEPALAV